MITGVYKETHFDAAHRLMHYCGKCSRLHGHRWSVEVWMEGTPEKESGILLDYNIIKDIINVYDHQVILNKNDPLVAVLTPFQTPVLTDSDPSSEVIAADIMNRINQYCKDNNLNAHVVKVCLWESDGCYAEVK